MKARHKVLSILFVTWIISGIDRMAISVAIPYIAADYQLTPMQSGILMSAFFAGYSLSQIPGGMLADRFGVRKVATLAMLWWSAFTAITGVAANFMQMLVVRFLFGLGEGVYPACAFKTIATWFPRQERATANAIMLASNPLGVAISPLIVVAIMSVWGWKAVFFLLFIPGVLFAAVFWKLVADRPSEARNITAAELTEIGQEELPGPGERKAGILEAVKEPNIIRYFLILFSFNITFWGFTTWMPTYLVQSRGFSMMQMGIVVSLPFFAGTVGSVLGGWISDRYFSNRRRLAIVATQIPSAFFLYMTFTASSPQMLIISQTLAGFFLASFFTAFWALPMNTVPKKLMGVTSGFINMAGQIAAFISPLMLGFLVEAMGGDFNMTFLLLIVSLLISAMIALTLPGGPRPRSASQADG
ncbi:MFS transporter [Niveispirillum fermenti]|uniref:MFS transporter n=1 Tax=Niveispirillum fermenti TaxID=1233113 RepID=UPI003A8BAA4E